MSEIMPEVVTSDTEVRGVCVRDRDLGRMLVRQTVYTRCRVGKTRDLTPCTRRGIGTSGICYLLSWR